MERLLKNIPNIQSDKSCNCGNKLISAQLDTIYPGIFSNTKCNDSHFEDFNSVPLQMRTESDFEIIGNQQTNTFSDDTKVNYETKLTDKEYVDHMVSHHKSGVELAKILLKSTKEPRLLLLSQTIILDQEKEMFQLNFLFNCIKYSWHK